MLRNKKIIPIFILILSCLLIVTLSACNKGNDESNGTTDGTSKKDEQTKAVTTEKEKPVETTKPVQVETTAEPIVNNEPKPVPKNDYSKDDVLSDDFY